MDIQFYYPRWGSEAIPWEQFAPKVRAAGYRGVEVFPFAEIGAKHDMLRAIADAGLAYVLLFSDLGDGCDFGGYTRLLEARLYELIAFRDSGNPPEFIVAQTGREYYTKEQMAICFSLCNRISRESGIPIIQETHRNKWSYAAHVVKDYLRWFPDLQLALDISHWVCVSESYLEDQAEAVQLAIGHTVHLHARVGHPEGPQVADPRSPENAEAVAHHLSWWKEWIASRAKSGVERCTITTEFGPHPYMPYKPYTNEPIADQWEINCWMKTLITENCQ